MSENELSEEHGLRPIGSLPLTIGSSRRALASIPNGSLANSATTGARSPTDQGRERSTGRQLSATAAASLRPVVEAMEGGDPYRIDKVLLASLPRSVASALRQLKRTWSDPEYGYDFEITGYELTGPVPAGDLAIACEMVAHCLSRVPEATLKAELARLRVSTKSRAEVDDDLAMGFQVYAEECAKYPADVVRDALRSLGRMEKFYPALSEVRDQLQRRGRARKALLAALKAAPQPTEEAPL